jgi:exodeoxyribonuclease III
VRVATWNVNSLSARWPRVEAWLKESDVDVLVIQETKQTDAKFPFGQLADLGYESAHYGLSQWNGVAILSRVGLADVVRGVGDDEEARCIAATCGGVRVLSCYVPNGRALDDPHYQYKLRWLAWLVARLDDELTRAPLVVAGDFNVAPTDRDCWDPAALAGLTHVSEPERAALAAVLDAGVVDVTRALHPDEPCFTWWDYRNASFGRGWGLRIDLVLVDPATAIATTAAVVDRAARKGDKPSDHAPIVVEFDRPA